MEEKEKRKNKEQLAWCYGPSMGGTSSAPFEKAKAETAAMEN